MSPKSNQWYVEMTSGITLGPMPFADLAGLAQSAALMRKDRVREGATSSWQEAQEVQGLFDAEDSSGEGDQTASKREVFSLSGYEVSETGVKNTIQKDSPGTESKDGVVRLDEFEVPPPGSAPS